MPHAQVPELPTMMKLITLLNAIVECDDKRARSYSADMLAHDIGQLHVVAARPAAAQVAVVQRLSVAGTPMPDSTGVEWLKPVPAGAKLYLHAAPAEQPVMSSANGWSHKIQTGYIHQGCGACWQVHFNDTGFYALCPKCDERRPIDPTFPPIVYAAPAGETAELVGRLRAHAIRERNNMDAEYCAAELCEEAAAILEFTSRAGGGE